MSKDRLAYLRTPEVNAKRARAIRKAFRLKKQLEKQGAQQPAGAAPVIAYEGDAAIHRVARSKRNDKLDVVKGLLATIALIMEE